VVSTKLKCYRNSSCIKAACKENPHVMHYSLNKSVRKAIMCTVHTGCRIRFSVGLGCLSVTLYYYISLLHISWATISLSHYINVNQLEWWIPRHRTVAPWHWRLLHDVTSCVIVNYSAVLLHFPNTLMESRWNANQFWRIWSCHSGNNEGYGLLACNEGSLPLSQQPKLIPISN
jgi:hypothetical protein